VKKRINNNVLYVTPGALREPAAAGHRHWQVTHAIQSRINFRRVTKAGGAAGFCNPGWRGLERL